MEADALALKEISQADAVAHLRAAGLADPLGQFTPESLAASGQAFRLTTAAGEGIFIVEKRGDHLWIHGAGAVGSEGLTGVGLALIEAMAIANGCAFVAYETNRPGLQRLAMKKGYRTTAVIQKKKVA